MIVLNIEEMSCEHCVARIGNLLSGMGMKHEVDLEKKQCSVECTEEELKSVIEELDDIGFTAAEVN